MSVPLLGSPVIMLWPAVVMIWCRKSRHFVPTMKSYRSHGIVYDPSTARPIKIRYQGSALMLRAERLGRGVEVCPLKLHPFIILAIHSLRSLVLHHCDH